MSRGKSDKVRYKPYEQGQQFLLPPSLEELVPAGHLARLVSEVIDDLNVEPMLRQKIPGGGASRYHPAMFAKVFTYGYMKGTCSCRLIAAALRENVTYMWLSGNQKPGFKTVNEFRRVVLKDVMEEVFVAAVKLLAAKGYVKLENYFVDGTKIESASGRYSYVWKKTIEKNDKKLDEKLRAYVKACNEVADAEDAEYGERDLEELGGKEKYTSEDVHEIAELLRTRLTALENGDAPKETVKEVKTALKDTETGCLERKEKYEAARETLGERNSYSKTDPDATFMRMKEDHLGNGQTKPAYNVQIGTENGFVTGYDVFQNPGDTRTLKPHLEKQKERLGGAPENVITDAGFGSEENYKYLEEEGVNAYVKYAMYHKEGTAKFKNDSYRSENAHIRALKFDEQGRCYTCPAGRKLVFKETKERENSSGFKSVIDVYECESCAGCPHKERCTKAAGNRQVERNERLLRYKREVRERLHSDEGYALMKRRSVEVETVFGQIKGNQQYRRFLLRGREKVACEWGLLVLGYNIRRLAWMMRQKAAAPAG